MKLRFKFLMLKCFACLAIAFLNAGCNTPKPSIFSPPQVTSTPLSQQVAATAMTRWADSFLLEGDKAAKWRYDQGVILKGIEGVWSATGEGKYFRYIQKSVDFYLDDKGNIRGYRPDEYNIDHINNGKVLLTLFRVTGREKYKLAADHLRDQLKTHPRTTEGGFWHKGIYPSQMWLDGLYMGQPFYAEYAMLFHEDTAFNDIARQFILMERYARDQNTGLLYHGWDESRKQKWANKETGVSPNFWGRALGWYGMAIVDALDYFPQNHPGKDSMIAILNRFASAVVKYQDASGLWYDVVDRKTEAKNYEEASASSMLIYTLAKGIRKGYLPESYRPHTLRGYDGIVRKFIRHENGMTNLHGTVSVSGLGGNPYRDGSFDYYMSEPVIVNDPKGMGAFIKCAVEMEMVPTLSLGKSTVVTLDNYYNNEWKKDLTGAQVRHHYLWEERSDGGFSTLGHIFNMHGGTLHTLRESPNASNLANTSIYIIVDPDTEKETVSPNQIHQSDVGMISDWVSRGGILVLFANDSGNANLDLFNRLTADFGIKFNPVSLNRVQGNQYQQGTIQIPSGHEIFKSARNVFVKEFSSLSLSKSSRPVLMHQGNVVIAACNWGQGIVLAIGDPWLYNEYVDGRRLPEQFDNFEAATDLVKWLLLQARKKV